MEIFKIFKKEKLNIVIVFAIIFPLFSIGVYMLKNLPANVGLACSIGGYFTLPNTIFTFLYSVLIGILTIGILQILRKKLASIEVVSTSILSLVVVFLSTVCTLCVLPAVTILGLNIGLGVFTLYNFYFRIIALVLLLVSIWLVELNLRKNCLLGNCNIK